MSIEAAGDRRLWEPANEFSRLYAAGDEGGAVDVAVEALREGIVFEPPFESIWWLADQLRRRRHFALALALVESAFERGFRGWRIFYLRALFHGLLRHFPKAFNLLDSAIRTAPADSSREMKLLKGRFLAATGEPQEALQCFEANLEFGKDSAIVADIAIRMAWRAENGDLAVTWLRAANQRYGTDVERLREFAQRACDRGLWGLAEDVAKEGLRVEKADQTLQRVVCRCLYNEGKTVDAIAAIERALKTDSGWVEGWRMLIRSLNSAGRKDDAAQAVAKATEVGSDDSLRLLAAELGIPVSKGTKIASARESDGRRRKRGPADPAMDSELQYRLSNIPEEFVPRWTAEAIAAGGNYISAVSSLAHSVRTLVLRETMARFGRHDLGYLWAVIEPLIHVSVLSAIFYYIRMRDTFGMNVVLFVATGIIPLFFYLKTFSSMTNALKQNRPLLNHAAVQPMDIFLGRALLEFFTQLLVLIIFATVIYFAVEPYRFGSVFSVVANLFGLWIMGIGMGLTIGSLVVYVESLPNIMAGFNRIIYITSGVFFTIEIMPPTVAEYAAYNPLLHFVDGVRANFNPLMGDSRIDIVYGYEWALSILAFGLIADRALRHKVLDR